MKKIERGLAILLLFCSLFVFAACDPGSYYFNREEMSEIVSVELITYDNPDQRQFFTWVSDHTSDLKAFNEHKISVLETLDGESIPKLIDALCGFHILYAYYAYDSPNGICLKLSYSNGDFLILSCNVETYAGYIGKYSSDGEVTEFIGCFSSRYDFESLVNNFFKIEVDE